MRKTVHIRSSDQPKIESKRQTTASRNPSKKIVIIAGPNGAGKTTFAEEFLPKEAGLLVFLNADLIARGLSPFAPEAAALEAGKIMLRQIAAHVSAGNSFAFETTLSGKNYARHIVQWRKLGYEAKLVFLGLESSAAAVRRVRNRVRQGGHHVPADVIRRRFIAGLHNFDDEKDAKPNFPPHLKTWCVC